jgi:hypothetical protein
MGEVTSGEKGKKAKRGKDKVSCQQAVVSSFYFSGNWQLVTEI